MLLAEGRECLHRFPELAGCALWDGPAWCGSGLQMERGALTTSSFPPSPPLTPTASWPPGLLIAGKPKQLELSPHPVPKKHDVHPGSHGCGHGYPTAEGDENPPACPGGLRARTAGLRLRPPGPPLGVARAEPRVAEACVPGAGVPACRVSWS